MWITVCAGVIDKQWLYIAPVPETHLSWLFKYKININTDKLYLYMYIKWPNNQNYTVTKIKFYDLSDQIRISTAHWCKQSMQLAT